jgi:hypothetical protein
MTLNIGFAGTELGSEVTFGAAGPADEFGVCSTLRWRRESCANSSLNPQNSLLAG